MSTPRCLRIAIETCRPCKSSTFHLRARIAQPHSRRIRDFSSTTPRCVPPEDITAGFPMPEVGSREIQGIGEEDSEKQLSSSSLSQATEKTPKPKDLRPRNQKIAKQIMESASVDASLRPVPKPLTDAKAQAKQQGKEEQEIEDLDPANVNVPPNVLAAFRTALRHKPTHGIPVASLQLRSYSVRNLELYADFALRAAYWLGLPCSGPVPLPKKIERWTVPKSPFIFKKTMENFERITRKRLLTIYDGDPTVVEIWLAFLRKWQFYGVGMKANVWQFESLDVAGSMDKQFAGLEKELDEKLRLFGFSKAAAGSRDLVRMMQKQGIRGPGVPVTDVRDKSRDPEEQTFFT